MEEQEIAIRSCTGHVFYLPAEWYKRVEWNNVSWQHIASKWEAYNYNFFRLYCELDITNRERLMDYVINYVIKRNIK